MKPVCTLTLACLLLLNSSAAWAQEQPAKKPDRIIEACPKPVSGDALSHIQQATGTIASPEEAKELIKATLGVDFPTATTNQKGSVTSADLESKGFYCIIHVARWNDPGSGGRPGSGTPVNPPVPNPPAANPPAANPPAANPPAANPPAANPPAANPPAGGSSTQNFKYSNWYVYRGGDHSLKNFNNHNRLYGAKRIWFLVIHLNKDPKIDYNFAYEVFVEPQLPTQVQHLLDAFTLFGSVARGAGNTPQSVYADGYMDQDTATSKITVNPKVIEVKRAESCVSENRCLCDLVALGDIKAIGNGATFDNEGLSWWDISIGVPVRRMSQVEFSSTANTVTAKKIDKQNLFAFINLFAPRVDVKEGDFGWYPHFVGGISIAKQPLHKYLLGAGWGPKFAQFYIGWLRTKQMEPQTLQQGQMATPEQLNSNLRSVWKNSVGFGLNVSVKMVSNALQKATK